MGIEPPGSASRAEAGACISSIRNVASQLKAEPRLHDDSEIIAGEHLIEVRRGEAHVLVVTAADLQWEPLAGWYDALAQTRAALLILGEPSPALMEQLPERVVLDTVAGDAGPEALYRAVHGLAERVELRRHDERKATWLKRYRDELGELVEIARAVTQQRDIDRLLGTILERSRYITGADAGSIYVVEGGRAADDERTLRFKLSQNDSCEFESSEFTMPVSARSIAGYAVVKREAINIPDVYEIAEDAPYGFDASFDRRLGYRTKSMMAVPMISAEDEVIGVIQLINKKRDGDARLDRPEAFEQEVIEFDERSEELLATLASQAGIALENALLYDEIKSIFEGFVRASVQAIEQRDPTTSGHSLRVSVLSCGLAEKIDRVGEGPYALTSFTRRELKELEYAALLHDFGKIGVREEVLVKAKKLYPHQLESIRQRIQYAMKAAESDVFRRRIERMQAGAGQKDLSALDEELTERRAELQHAWDVICSANEPTVLSEGDFSKITELGERCLMDADGGEQPLLSPEEVRSLQVRRGSLNTHEMNEIRSHVVHTYNFLSRIPWGKSFTNVPRVAGAHHEKLDGSGYPYQLTGDQIPLPSKIMTVCDIYDALTARDRPYKKAVPVERALQILGFEVEEGKLDAELVRVFKEAEVFRLAEQELEY